jgi:PAS domain S-box-containing protein
MPPTPPTVEPQAPHRKPGFSPEERYRVLVAAVSDYAIYMLDPDGFVVSWNAGAERLKGYTEAEILGRHFSAFYEPEDVSTGLPTRALLMARTTGRFEAEGWRRRKNGERFWAVVIVNPIISPAGELIGYAKVTRDLTERRAAEEALRRSEEQFRLLVQAVTDYAIYMLDPDGIITNWNAGAQRAKGYKPHEVIGSHFSRFYRQEDRDSGLPARALATAAGEGRFEGEGWRVRKDGTEFWANVVIDPIFDSQGVLRGYAKVTRDITDKRNAQLALEQAREALFQSQKLEAIGQLTGGVAHDFNNLLMVVLTSLELLRRRMPDDKKLHALVDTATQGAKRGVTLTQRMLAFARRQELRPESVDLEALAGGMRELLERTLGPTIAIETAFEAGLGPVLVDPHQLELAILNLAVNARDAMPHGRRAAPGGARGGARGHRRPGEPEARHLRAAVHRRHRQRHERADARARRRALLHDQGRGQGHRARPGDGAGPGGPVGRQVRPVEHGGRAARAPSCGCPWQARLRRGMPRGRARVRVRAGAGAGPAMVPPPAARGLKVLAVDDDPLVLAGTASMLEDLGHAVLAASSAEEALGLLDESVHLVISDQVMPKMTGAQLFRELQHKHPALPFVLASGYADLDEDVSAMAVNLPKPFNQAQLSAAIAAAMDR